MQGNPKKHRHDLENLLPARIAQGYGQTGITPSGGFDVHGQLDELHSDPDNRTMPPGAYQENRDLAAALLAVFKASRKPNDNRADDVKGPRFIFTWRMYPNVDNTQVDTPGGCGCGCSCGG
jgi:hypothetical protein